MRKLLHRFWRIISAPFRFIIWVVKVIFRWLKTTYNNILVLFTEEPEDTPLPDALSKAVENPMGLMEHINALRKHIFRSVIFMVLTTAASFVYIRQLLDWLTKPIGGIESLQAIEVTEPIGVVMRVALLAGFSLALPYIILELWLFAAPGLKKKARISGLIVIPIATLLFIIGMAFAYYVMMPTALPFLLNFMGIKTAVRPASYVKFVTSLLFWVGIAFEFPLIIFALAGMGIVKAQTLASQWRIAVVLIAIMAAAITPTIDPINMGLVMGPMILLYFVSILLAYIAQGKQEKDEQPS